MRKVVACLALVSVLGLSSTTAFAYGRMNYRTTAYTAPQNAAYAVQQEVYDEAAAIENYVDAQEARKAYLKDMYDRGLISKSRYDLSIAVIQENIDYVLQNGFSVSPYGGYGGGFGGGCCLGW